MGKEILAGLSTFFTAAYLLILYPQIFSAGGMDAGSALTASILTIVISTLFLGLYSNFPVLLAPGLSAAVFLVYSAILVEHISWQTALGIVFWSGLILFLLTVFNIRRQILHHLPSSIKAGAVAAIGLFLIAVALKNLHVFEGELFNTQNSIVIFGLMIFSFLHRLKIASAFLLTILSCWLIAIPLDLVHPNGIVAWPPSLAPTLFQLDFISPFYPESLGPMLSVILICLFDTSASIAALAKLAGKIDKKSQVKNIDKILIPDGPSSMVGALLGATTLSFTLESSSGIKAGGRGKVTAITAALCCLLGLFFYPLISTIPLFAATPVIIAIGFFMLQSARDIQWKKPVEWIPALLILIITPLTFSIYQGFASGIIAYTVLKALFGEWREVHPVFWTLDILFGAHLIWTLTV